jgi:hypothetical protein
MLGKDQTQEFHKDPTIIIPGLVDFLNLRINDTFDKNSIYQATTPLQNFEMQMSSVFFFTLGPNSGYSPIKQ